MFGFLVKKVCFFIFSVNIVLLSTQIQARSVYVYQSDSGAALLTDKKQTSGTYKQVKVIQLPESNIHSYANWGSSEAAVAPSASASRNAYDHIIRAAAQTYGVSEGLIKAVMHTESGFNRHARSPVGAQGLMQLMPATAQRFNVSNAYDPTQNIHGGVQYLSWLLKRFNGNVALALAGYNAGEGNVTKYGGIPPFRETQDYVRRVMSRYNNLYSDGLALSTSSSMNTAQVVDVSSKVGSVGPKREIVFINGVYTDRMAN